MVTIFDTLCEIQLWSRASARFW